MPNAFTDSSFSPFYFSLAYEILSLKYSSAFYEESESIIHPAMPDTGRLLLRQ